MIDRGKLVIVCVIVCLIISLISIPVGRYEEEHQTKTWYRIFPFSLGMVGMFGLILWA